MREGSENLKNQMYDWLLSELREAEYAGMRFQVDGKPYTMGDAKGLYQVMENAYYMKSYEEDDRGKIVQVDFDHLKDV